MSRPGNICASSVSIDPPPQPRSTTGPDGIAASASNIRVMRRMPMLQPYVCSLRKSSGSKRPVGGSLASIVLILIDSKAMMIHEEHE